MKLCLKDKKFMDNNEIMKCKLDKVKDIVDMEVVFRDDVKRTEVVFNNDDSDHSKNEILLNIKCHIEKVFFSFFIIINNIKLDL